MKGPRDPRILVKSALAIKAANVLKPRILSCSGIFLGVIGGKVATVDGVGVRMFHNEGCCGRGQAWVLVDCCPKLLGKAVNSMRLMIFF